MPILTSKQALYVAGCRRVAEFCTANEIQVPTIVAVDYAKWHFGYCAYYRPTEIKICLQACAHVAGAAMSRAWSWPGNTVDREPFGVLCHELGHHVDWLLSKDKGTYHGNFSRDLMRRSGEKELTSYCPNPAEWFAEMFRLFVTNHALLKLVRPKTHALLVATLQPVSNDDWVKAMGGNVPERILKAARNKFA